MPHFRRILQDRNRTITHAATLATPPSATGQLRPFADGAHVEKEVSPHTEAELNPIISAASQDSKNRVEPEHRRLALESRLHTVQPFFMPRFQSSKLQGVHT